MNAGVVDRDREARRRFEDPQAAVERDTARQRWRAGIGRGARYRRPARDDCGATVATRSRHRPTVEPRPSLTVWPGDCEQPATRCCSTPPARAPAQSSTRLGLRAHNGIGAGWGRPRNTTRRARLRAGREVDVVHDTLIGPLYSERFPERSRRDDEPRPVRERSHRLLSDCADRVPIIAISHDQA